MEVKSKRGRPKLDQSSYKGHVIRVRVNPKEAKVIEEFCKRNNLTLSNLIRKGINQLLRE